MIIEVEGQRLRVAFYHANGMGTRQTSCVIRTGGGILIGNGTTKVHRKDMYCKETGRKLSLERAIAHFSRQDRTVIWKAYHNRRNNDKEPGK